MNVRNIIQISYGVPGILSYLLVFYAFHGLRDKLPSSFMVIYALMASINTATWINLWLFIRLLNEPFFFFYYEWLQNQTLLIELHAFLVTHFYYARSVNVLLLAFDRFTGVYGDWREKKFEWWNTYYLPIGIFAHASMLGAQLLVKLPKETFLRFDPVKVTFYSVAKDATRVGITEYFAIAAGTSLIVAVMGLTIASFVFLEKLKRRDGAASDTYTEKSPLLVISGSIAFTQFMNLMLTTLLAVRHQTNYITTEELKTVYEYMQVCTDVFILLPAVLTITLPGTIREHLVKKIFPCWAHRLA